MVDISNEYIQGLQDQVNSFDFDAERKKYAERLNAISPPQQNFDIFDLATSLSQGLTAQMQTDRPNSIGGGFALGFNKASEDMKQRNADYAKAKQQVALEASRLAMQSEEKAKDYLNDFALKTIGDTNKEIKTSNISWIDQETGERKEGTLNKAGGLFKDIMNDPEKYQAKEVVQQLFPDENIYKELDKETAKQITTSETTWQEESDAQVGILDKTNSARYYANQLDESAFGPAALLKLGLNSVFIELGMGGLVDKEELGASFAVNSVGTGLAMGLIGQTKGAISDREMKMFLKASATLGNSKKGFLNILQITDKIANRAIGFNEEWAKERADLQSRNVSLAEIRSRQAGFKAAYHRREPMFEGSNDYNPDLSIEANLANMKEGTEAYNLVSQMTDEGIAVYDRIRQKHATFGDPDNISKSNALGIKDVPDGAVFQRTVNGVDYYRLNGDLYTNKN